MVGQEISCPSCSHEFIVEAGGGEAEEASEMPVPAPGAVGARVGHTLKVKSSGGAADSLIEKPKGQRLEVAARAAVRIQIKTFLHSNFEGQEAFDAEVGSFLQQLREDHIMGLHPVQHSRMDEASKQVVQDFGLVVVFKS